MCIMVGIVGRYGASEQYFCILTEDAPSDRRIIGDVCERRKAECNNCRDVSTAATVNWRTYREALHFSCRYFRPGYLVRIMAIIDRANQANLAYG